ncbi:hypothetical protein NIES4071_59500 [Calothrix sp. NIES-4071]|nr:hypothetical protein NIES4071_59500 [Calothrix sp. NIES-4071]BAZ60257.1 hypothetical protein NIES4105_59450 [Calothrix sp. NIES-4105]
MNATKTSEKSNMDLINPLSKTAYIVLFEYPVPDAFNCIGNAPGVQDAVIDGNSTVAPKTLIKNTRLCIPGSPLSLNAQCDHR